MTRLAPTTFDSLFKMIDDSMSHPFNSKQFEQTYPPYNHFVDSERNVEVLEIAVTGFDQEDVSVEVNDDERRLTVEAKANTTSTDFEYVTRSLGKRSFIRSWRLSPGSEVLSAEMKQGVLRIEINRNVPGSTSRRIEVKGA